jgi:conserved oligomeric Golgi complex subunit 5
MGKGGENPEGQTGKLLANPRFAPLKQDNFNPAEFTSRVLAGSHTTAQAKSEELKESVRLLEGELSEQIIGKHHQLLSTARKVVDTEDSIQEVTASLSTVQLAVKRIRAELVGPYEHVKAQTTKLRNLHSTVDLLRHLIYRLKLTQKLKVQMQLQPGAIDLAKAARILTDISSIDSNVDFSGVEAATADDEYLSNARQSIRTQAEVGILKVHGAQPFSFAATVLQRSMCHVDLHAHHLTGHRHRAPVGHAARNNGRQGRPTASTSVGRPHLCTLHIAN